MQDKTQAKENLSKLIAKSETELSTGHNELSPEEKGNNILLVLGTIFLLYAFLGNYITLPGYLRYLERGRTSISGAKADITVIIGAMKTILWMFSFQLGIYFTLLGILKLLAVKKSVFLSTVIGGFMWLMIAGIPKLPGPYRLFFAISGFIVLILIVSVLLYWYKNQKIANEPFNYSSYYKLIGYMFFALASWDVCGLGTTGRILHIDTAITAETQGLIITQTTKIMVEFLLAWMFSFIGYYSENKISKVWEGK
jgi:hypothetical protein